MNWRLNISKALHQRLSLVNFSSHKYWKTSVPYVNILTTPPTDDHVCNLHGQWVFLNEQVGWTARAWLA